MRAWAQSISGVLAQTGELFPYLATVGMISLSLFLRYLDVDNPIMLWITIMAHFLATILLMGMVLKLVEFTYTKLAPVYTKLKHHLLMWLIRDANRGT